MKHLYVILVMFMVCSLMLGCQPVVEPTSTPMAENPSVPQIDPTTVPTEPTTVPTDPLPTEPLPSDPPIKQTVTPVNTYVFRDDSGTFPNKVWVTPDMVWLTEPLPLGEIRFSDNVQKAIEEHSDETVIFVVVQFLPTLMELWPDTKNFPAEVYTEYRNMLMTRFEEAGYETWFPMTGMRAFMFGTWMSVEQLKALDCGDDVSLYIATWRIDSL